MEAIARYLKEDFICAGSYPAFVVANELCEYLGQESAIRLKYNDIDVYHGSFGDGKINRIDCKWTKIEGINPEVNLISCTKLNTSSLIVVVGT